MKTFNLILLILFINCTVDVRQVPLYEFVDNINSESDKSVIIDNFLIIEYNKEYLEPLFKNFILKVLKDEHYFQNILFKNSKNITDYDKYYKLDFRITIDFQDEFIWSYSWPAIYPFLGYWPYQHRHGKYTFVMEYFIKSKENEVLAHDYCINKETKDVKWYGFYRTSRFEEMIKKTNLEGVKNCSKTIIEKFRGL